MKCESSDYQVIKLALGLLTTKIAAMSHAKNLVGTLEYSDLMRQVKSLDYSLDSFINEHDKNTNVITDQDIESILFEVSQQLERVEYYAKKRYYDLNKKDLIAVGELPPIFPTYGYAKKLVYQDDDDADLIPH